MEKPNKILRRAIDVLYKYIKANHKTINKKEYIDTTLLFYYYKFKSEFALFNIFATKTTLKHIEKRFQQIERLLK